MCIFCYVVVPDMKYCLQLVIVDDKARVAHIK